MGTKIVDSRYINGVDEIRKIKNKYKETLNCFADLPDYNRKRAERRFLILREFEEYFSVNEKKRLGKKYKVHVARKIFCKQKGISLSTFLNWRRLEKKYGIIGLVPHYGTKRSKTGEIIFTIKDNIAKPPQSHSITAIIKFDIYRPVNCIQAIIKLIENQHDFPEARKAASLAPFKFILSFSKPHFFKPQSLPLAPHEIRKLERYKTKTHRNHWAKAVALLMAHKGCTVFEIAIAAGRSTNTIYNWFRQYKKNGLSFIETKVAQKRRAKMWQVRTTRIVDILHTPPMTYNINRTSWTYDTIIKAYLAVHGEPLPKSALKRVIKETKYTWRHARKVLTSPDPNYKKKVEKVLSVLRNTQEDEAFFFIDEFGPYQVKKYGGQALTDKEVLRIIPNRSTKKGKVQAIAALEAFTNQLSWQFIDHKDTEAVISLLVMLRKKYSEKRKLFITWDTIATHQSNLLSRWIEKNNTDSIKKANGPIIKVVPLPSKAQFLNVIESVFGGMKKAVIYNSDYSSRKEMEEAIHRHFLERNIFFKKNPKRVGHKIWDKEDFDLDRLHGGLFKKM